MKRNALLACRPIRQGWRQRNPAVKLRGGGMGVSKPYARAAKPRPTAFSSDDTRQTSEGAEKGAETVDFDNRLTVLSLFSGIGGIDLGLEMTGHFRTVAFCEIEEYPRKVLRKHWGAEIPIFEDVHDVTADTIQQRGIGRVDVIAGGFPCQDISQAGKQAGIKAGTRSGLWFEFARIIGDLRPRYVVLENVAAITRVDGVRVIGDLAQMGYDAEWCTLFASDTGAPHTRERWFCVAYLSNTIHTRQDIESGHHTRPENGSAGTHEQSGQHLRGAVSGCSQLAYSSEPRRASRGSNRGSGPVFHHINRDAAQNQSEWQGWVGGFGAVDEVELENPNKRRPEGSWQYEQSQCATSIDDRKTNHAFDATDREWDTQSRLGRVFNGLPARLDGNRWVARPNEAQHTWEPPRTVSGKVENRNQRIEALGNAVIPQVVAFVGECLWRFHMEAHRPTAGESAERETPAHEDEVRR